MTCIAWDGITLAADSMCETAGMAATVSKIRIVRGAVLAVSGGYPAGLMLIEWFRDGADPKSFPDVQKTDDWARLVVFDETGLRHYEQQPVAMRVLDPYMAFGSGRDFAMGAMAMGADAVRAVEVAAKHCTTVGGPVRAHRLSE